MSGHGGTAEVVLPIARAVPPLAQRLAEGRIYGDPTAIVGVNDSGDRQKALDVGAHDHMIAALRAAGVRQVLSEEAEAVITLDPGGAFDVAIDPIDGSGSIGIGAPLGLLLTVLPAAPEGLADAAAIGNVFASRPPQPAVDAALAANGGAWVLFMYGNYAGDVMNFDVAAELLEMEGVSLRARRRHRRWRPRYCNGTGHGRCCKGRCRDGGHAARHLQRCRQGLPERRRRLVRPALRDGISPRRQGFGCGECGPSDQLSSIIVANRDGIVHRGKAGPGQKTMLDAWHPAAEAVLAGRPLSAAAQSASAGAEATTAMVAQLGRAERLGERSRGHPDPGAVSAAMLIEEIARFSH